MASAWLASTRAVVYTSIRITHLIPRLKNGWVGHMLIIFRCCIRDVMPCIEITCTTGLCYVICCIYLADHTQLIRRTASIGFPKWIARLFFCFQEVKCQ